MYISDKNIVLLLIFMLFSIPASVFDIRSRRIPNWIVFSGTVVLFTVRYYYFKDSPVSLLINMFFGGMMFYSIRFLTKGKLGMGDVKFAVLIALFLEFPLFFIAVATASVFGLIFALAGISIGKINKTTKIPFVPFLTTGSIIASIIKNIFL